MGFPRNRRAQDLVQLSGNRLHHELSRRVDEEVIAGKHAD
jgi:hypothetical protein